MIVQIFSILGTLALSLFLLVSWSQLLIPIVIGLVLWFFINTLADLFQKVIPKRRWVSVILSIITLAIFVYIPFQLAASSIPQLIEVAPSYQKNLEDLWHKLLSFFGISETQFFDQIRKSANIPSLASAFAGMIATLAGQFVLIILYAAFLLVDQAAYPYKMEVVFKNQATRSKVDRVLGNIVNKSKTYIRVKTILSVLTGVLSYSILAIVDVDFAGFWAVLIFLLNYIPTIGSVIGVIFPALLTLIQFESIIPFFIVLFGCGTIQFLIGNALEPKMMGSSLNLSTFVILLALTTWSSIWGVIGAFLSVPITVILMIIFSEFDRTKGIAVFLSGDGKIAQG